MDLATVSATISSIKTAMDIAKTLKDTDLSLEKAETKLQLAELVSALADAKMQIAEIQELVLMKDQENKKLQEQLNLNNTLSYEKPYYWQILEGKKDGPYCQQCWDKDRRLIRLQSEDNGEWRCFTCSGYYRDSTYKESWPSPI